MKYFIRQVYKLYTVICILLPLLSVEYVHGLILDYASIAKQSDEETTTSVDNDFYVSKIEMEENGKLLEKENMTDIILTSDTINELSTENNPITITHDPSTIKDITTGNYVFNSDDFSSTTTKNFFTTNANSIKLANGTSKSEESSDISDNDSFNTGSAIVTHYSTRKTDETSTDVSDELTTRNHYLTTTSIYNLNDYSTNESKYENEEENEDTRFSSRSLSTESSTTDLPVPITTSIPIPISTSTTVESRNQHMHSTFTVPKEVREVEANDSFITEASTSTLDTNLYGSAETPLQEAAIIGDSVAVVRLLKEGHPWDARNSQGDTVVHLAAANGYVDVMDALISAGARVNIRGYRMRTPLICAAIQGHVDSVGHLLENGANFNIPDADGYTALSMATLKGHLGVIENMTLFSKYLEPETVRSALRIAAQLKRIDLFKAILNIELRYEKRSVSCFRDHETLRSVWNEEAFWALIDANYNPGNHALSYSLWNRIDVNYNSGNELTDAHALSLVLEEASAKGNVDVLPIIIAAGGQKMENALCAAADQGQLKSIEMLIELGAEVNKESEKFNGYTPLYIAVRKGNMECVNILLDAGANPNREIRNSDGSFDTPLRAAVAEENLEIAKALLEASGKVDKETTLLK